MLIHSLLYQDRLPDAILCVRLPRQRAGFVTSHRNHKQRSYNCRLLGRFHGSLESEIGTVVTEALSQLSVKYRYDTRMGNGNLIGSVQPQKRFAAVAEVDRQWVQENHLHRNVLIHLYEHHQLMFHPFVCIPEFCGHQVFPRFCLFRFATAKMGTEVGELILRGPNSLSKF